MRGQASLELLLLPTFCLRTCEQNRRFCSTLQSSRIAWKPRLKTKGQASIELLLLLAASAAFLVAVIPSVNGLRDASIALSEARQVESALQSVAFLARQAHVMGDGTRLEKTIHLPVETVFGYDEGGQTITASFQSNGEEKTLKEKAGFRVEAGEKANGKTEVTASNSKGTITLAFEPLN